MQQSTQGAELNSEATLNCNGNDFKCVNLTHYQPCSLTERKGQEPQWTINGIVLPCLIGQPCNDEKSVSCAVSRPVLSIERETPSQIPVKVTVVQEPAVNGAKVSEVIPNKILPAEPNSAPPTEHKKPVASPIEHKKPMASPIEHKKTMALPMEHKKVVAATTEHHEKIVASSTEHEKLVASSEHSIISSTEAVSILTTEKSNCPWF